MKLCIEIGGVAVELCHRYEYIKSLCRDYLTDAPPVLSVSVTEAQIEEEQKLSGGIYAAAVCESTCLHREVAKALVPHGFMLIHSAVVAVDGEAYAFLAKSGVGKSTHIRLWRETFGERAIVVNGDKPLFSFRDGTLRAHGTPWRGKEGWGEPVSLPVKAFCLLERGEANAITPADSGDVVGRIFHQVLLPTDVKDLELFMRMMEQILKDVPFYRLRCNREREAAAVAYRGMKGKSI